MMEFETKCIWLMMWIRVRGCSWVFPVFVFNLYGLKHVVLRVREEPLEPHKPDLQPFNRYMWEKNTEKNAMRSGFF